MKGKYMLPCNACQNKGVIVTERVGQHWTDISSAPCDACDRGISMVGIDAVASRSDAKRLSTQDPTCYFQDKSGNVYKDGKLVKQAAGKMLPSSLVPWYVYDEMLAANAHVYLLVVSAQLRTGWYERDDLILYGSAIIHEMRYEDKSPELELTKVYELGAKKYSPNGWMEAGVPNSNLALAGWRHINKALNGERVNTDDGDCLHLAHALWQVIAMVWNIDNKPEVARL